MKPYEIHFEFMKAFLQHSPSTGDESYKQAVKQAVFMADVALAAFLARWPELTKGK